MRCSRCPIKSQGVIAPILANQSTPESLNSDSLTMFKEKLIKMLDSSERRRPF
jgi:hypothetical protein